MKPKGILTGGSGRRVRFVEPALTTTVGSVTQ